MYRWLDFFIASWHNFLPDLDGGCFHANSSTVALFSANFVVACCRPKCDHCLNRHEFLHHIASGCTCSRFGGYESRAEPKLKANPSPDASHPGDEDNWLTWRGLMSPHSSDSFCGLKKQPPVLMKETFLAFITVLSRSFVDWAGPVKNSISYHENCNKLNILHLSITQRVIKICLM